MLDTLDITRPGDYEKIEYLKAMELAADGISALGHRYAAEAKSWQRQSRMRSAEKELLQIAKTCDQVPEKPARTFHEAIQSMYIYQTCIFMEQNAASYNPGRMDQYLLPIL